MSGALPQQPEEFLDHLRHVPHDHVPTIEEELDEYLLLREVKSEEKFIQFPQHSLYVLLVRAATQNIGGTW